MLIEKKRREHRAAIVSGEEHVVHGFRSTASTLLNDNTLFSADATEKELAHQQVDAVRRA